MPERCRALSPEGFRCRRRTHTSRAEEISWLKPPLPEDGIAMRREDKSLKMTHVSDPFDEHSFGVVVKTWTAYHEPCDWLEVQEVVKVNEYWSAENQTPVHFVMEGEDRALCGVAVGLPNDGPFARIAPIICAECRILEKTVLANES